MLQITIHYDHGISRGQLQSGKNTGLLTEIPGEFRSPHSRILRCLFLDPVKRAVLGTVADKHQFIIYPVSVQQFAQYLRGIRNILFFVICR